MRLLQIAFFLMVTFIALPVRAQDGTDSDPIPSDMSARDSIDYMMDDGIMSKEEMEDEAKYIHNLCRMNSMQSSYYNCDCIAGSFLVRREKLGPLAPQGKIYEAVMADTNGRCINTTQIAGDSYAHCLDFSAAHRELAPDNEDYCKCVANRAAKTFARYPKFDTMYVTSIDSNAMIWCSDPKNRPPKPRSATR